MTTAIDLFAGAGGFSTGAVMAGHRVIWAANHFKPAVETHFQNHPTTEHALQDLQQACWPDVPSHDILLASPACQGHSPARGKEKPHHDATRSTAWAVISCAEYHKPDIIVIENVPAFLKWVLAKTFFASLDALGYTYSINIVDAADCGVPQNRKRLVVIATKSVAPLYLNIEKKPHVPASTFLDIDGEDGWSPIEIPTRKQKTKDRVAAGRKRFGDIFIMPYYSRGSGLTGRSIHRPIGTIPTVDRWAIVRGDEMRMLTIDEYKAGMSFSKTYKIPTKPKRLGVHLLGNAVPPLMAQTILEALHRT